MDIQSEAKSYKQIPGTSAVKRKQDGKIWLKSCFGGG